MTPALLEHVTAALEVAVDRHLSLAKPWYPHELVPWTEAVPWGEGPGRLPAAARAAVQLNLLTEDNLPGYHAALDKALGAGDAWRTWLDRWTAEEGRHAIALRDWLVVTGSVDPVALEDDRMATVSGGYYAPGKDALHVIAYVSLQELATRVSHRRTGLLSEDASLDALLTRVAADENLHMVLYRSLLGAALDVAPAEALAALVDELAGFTMPGAGIPGFARRAAVVARAGVYDLQVHRDEVVLPLVRHWDVLERPLPADAEVQRDRLVAVLAELDRRVAVQQERRERRSLVSA